MRSFNTEQIKVTLKSSLIGHSLDMRRTFASLGLRRRGASRVLPNVNAILGQINKVIQFVKVEPVN